MAVVEVDSVQPEADAQAFERVVRSRRSVRRFLDEPIPEAVLDRCLELAVLAPNSSNLQPWGFHVVREPALRARLAAACFGQRAATTAPTLIVVTARTATWRATAARILADWPDGHPPPVVRQYYAGRAQFFYAQGPLGLFGLVKRAWYGLLGLRRPVPRNPVSRADMRLWAAKSTALAAGQLMLALRAQGWDSCPMEGFDERRVRRLIGYPRDAFTVMVVAVGRRAPDGIYQSRQRLPLDEVVQRH